ncbi:rCG30256 [Rattus norvegicus]|uniref:RCG30256 n=1 Tax=Rattus norvegicus TaxID=10116 RepID=A6ILZ2_RAT|nr:rCG30256 [Rattus norvegicus]
MLLPSLPDQPQGHQELLCCTKDTLHQHWLIRPLWHSMDLRERQALQEISCSQGLCSVVKIDSVDYLPPWTRRALRLEVSGWIDGSVVKSTDCSSRGPEFKSQQPRGVSQPSVIRCPILVYLKTATVYNK